MSLDRRVLEQDRPQYEQSTKKTRDQRDKEALQQYEQEKIDYEKQTAEAEAKYQKELKAYEDAQKNQSRSVQLKEKFDAEIAELNRQKTVELNDAHYATWGPSGDRDRTRLSTAQNKIANKYESRINKLQEESRLAVGRTSFEEAYPGVSLTQSVLRDFKERKSSNLIQVYERKQESKAIQAELSRQSSIQTARNAPSYTSQQSYLIQKGSTGLRGTPTEEMQARATQIKETPNFVTGKKAIEQRARLINVKTVETIYGGKQIPTNPRAYVASIDKQNLAPSGMPIREKPIIGETGPSALQSKKVRVEESSDFTGQQTQKVRISDPKIDRMIGVYGYEKTNEIITNRKKIAERNNLILTKQYLEYGKSIGVEYVKVKQKQGSRTFSINQLGEITKSEGEISFVRSPEMRKDKLSQIQQTRDFLSAGQKAGFESFSIKSEGKSETVFLEDRRLAAERIRAAPPDSKFRFNKTDMMKKGQKDYFESRRELTNLKPYQSLKAISPEGKETIIDVTNKKEAQKQIRSASMGTTFEPVTTNEDNFSKYLRKTEKDDPTGIKTELGITMSSLYNIAKTGSEKVVMAVTKGPEMIIGKTIIKKPGLESSLGRKIIPDSFNLGPETYVPQSAASSFIGSPFRASAEAKDFPDFMEKTGKYSGEAQAAFMKNPVKGLGGAAVQTVMLLAPTKLPASVTSKFSQVASKANLYKAKNFISKKTSDIAIGIETGKNVRTVRQFAEQNYPDYKNKLIIQPDRKNPKEFYLSAGVEEKRPNIADKPVKSQLFGYKKYFKDKYAPAYPVYSKIPKKQIIPVADKPGDVLVRFEFGKKFKVKEGRLVEIKDTLKPIERPSYPQLAKQPEKPILSEPVNVFDEIRKDFLKQSRTIKKLPREMIRGVTSLPRSIYDEFKQSAKKALLPPKKTKPLKTKKVDWITEYSTVPEKESYFRTNKIVISSADPQFEKTALTLGLKRYGKDSFVKAKPSEKLVKELEKVKKEGFLVETARGQSAPLKLFRVGRQKTIREQRPIDIFTKKGKVSGRKIGIIDKIDIKTGPSPIKYIFTRKTKSKPSQFDYLGEKKIVTRFYEARAGLGRPEFQLESNLQSRFIKKESSFKDPLTLPRLRISKEKSIGVGSVDAKKYFERLGKVQLSKEEMEKALGREITPEEFARTQQSFNPPRRYEWKKVTPYDFGDLGKSKGVAGGSGKGLSASTINKITSQSEQRAQRISAEELLKVKKSGLSKKEYYKKQSEERRKTLDVLFPTRLNKITKPVQVTNYLQTVSNYKPTEKSQEETYNIQGQKSDFTTEEETIRYPELKTIKQVKLSVIPKGVIRSFSGQRGQIKTVQVVKISQEQDLLLSTVQITKQETRQQTKQVQKMRNKTAEMFASRPKLLTDTIPISITVTKIKTGLTQTPVQQLKQPQLLKQIQKLEFKLPFPAPRKTIQKPPRIRLLPFMIPKEEKKKEPKRKSQPGEKADFLGSVPESQVVGIFNRLDVVYGQRKINRLLKGDIRVVKGQKRSGRNKSVPKKDIFGFKKSKTKKPKFF